MHDERWTLGIAENGDIRLRDQNTGETLRFGGPRGLYDALGVLADWRDLYVETVPRKGNYGAPGQGNLFGADAHGQPGFGQFPDSCGWPNKQCIGHAPRPQYPDTDTDSHLPDYGAPRLTPDVKGRVHFLLPHKARMACGRRVVDGNYWGSALNAECVNCPDCLIVMRDGAEPQNADYGVPSGVQGGQWANDETGVPGSYEPDGDVRHHNGATDWPMHHANRLPVFDRNGCPVPDSDEAR